MKRSGRLNRDPAKQAAWRARSKPLERSGSRRDPDPEWLDEASRLREEEGLSYPRIAAALGTTKGRVYYHLARRDKFAYTCEICGSDFTTSEQGQRACSWECRCKLPVSPGTIAKRLASTPDRNGKNNPNFRHGRRVTEHEQKLAREFNLGRKGESCCRYCGSTNWVQAHHAVPRSKAPAGRYDLRNCLPLCASCHQSWHKMGLAIPRGVFTAEEWEFVSSLVGPGWLDQRYPPAESLGMEADLLRECPPRGEA